MSRNFDLLRITEPVDSGYQPASGTNSWSNTWSEPHDHRGVVDDEVMKLVQRLFVLPDGTQTPEAIAFCGVEKGAGCSWVCANASRMLAAQGLGTVCVVDANFYSPSLHHHFRVANRAGFAESLKSTDLVRDFVHRVSAPNLWLMTSGCLGKETLNPSRLRTRISELRNEFDFLLIDIPGILSYGDATLLAHLTDGAVLVVGSNMTRRESARMAKESLEAASVPILGAVLNKRRFPIPEAIYKKL
ncbi:MAG TPA: CpsD/CapB family tyrosine-protein kinase [Candidatus Acidoferrales bacterium]|nr:CpsD/CapB family tyrosine-protein kinase [Candidatus Acidoferrales bacterium]